ncbi:MAG TPA: FAD-dependent oxidoreductase, partial [Cyclobacteriaceae bacterium]|nr:FAD-dependent oxidoreductase [Cyclobacteriaceae bacterium]
MSVYKNVIIVGAGFSGIAAARVLHLANIPFILLEARDRLGGRTHTQKISDTAYIELGGQWSGATQERMYALAKEHGIEGFETYNKGKNIIDLNKKIR